MCRVGVRQERRPVLVLMVGVPGTGKSTLARRLARALPAELVQSDRVRRSLFAEPKYTGAEASAVYGWCHAVLRSLLGTGRSAVFDATNLDERHRRRVYDLADACGAALIVVWTACSPSTVQQRMLRRRFDRDEEDLSEAHWGTYLELRPRAEPISRPHLVVNTRTDTAALVARVAALAAAASQDVVRPPAERVAAVATGRRES